MVGCDVHEHSDIGLEVEHIVELEGAYLEHIPLVVALCHLHGV